MSIGICTSFLDKMSISSIAHFFFLKKFKYLFLAVLVLHCYTGFSLVAMSRGCSLVAVRGLLIVVAFLDAEHRL